MRGLVPPWNPHLYGERWTRSGPTGIGSRHRFRAETNFAVN